MKENLSDITDPERKAFITDAEIIRYLRAREFDVAKSEALLRDSLEWRFVKYKPHLIDPRCAVLCSFFFSKVDLVVPHSLLTA